MSAATDWLKAEIKNSEQRIADRKRTIVGFNEQIASAMREIAQHNRNIAGLKADLNLLAPEDKA